MERINFQNNAKIYITAMKLYLTIKVEIILYTQWNETISVMQLNWKEVSKKEQLLLLLCHTHTPDVQTTHVFCSGLPPDWQKKIPWLFPDISLTANTNSSHCRNIYPVGIF